MPDDEIARLEAELEELRALPTARASNAFDAMLARMVEESRELRAMLIPEIRVDAPSVTVTPQVLNPDVIVNVPDQRDALVSLSDLLTRLLEALVAKEFAVTVNVPPAEVTVMEGPEPPKRITVQRNKAGLIESAIIEGGDVG